MNKIAVGVLVGLVGWFCYFQLLDWFFMDIAQGLKYFEFIGSVFS